MASAYRDLASSATPKPPYRVWDEGREPRPSQEASLRSTDSSWHDVSTSQPGVRMGVSAVPSSAVTANTAMFRSRRGSLLPTAPGSFNADMNSLQTTRSVTPKPDGPFLSHSQSATHLNPSGLSAPEQRQLMLREEIEKELKIKKGTENMLDALLLKNPKQTKDQRLMVESELSASSQKINRLQLELDEEVLRSNTQTPAVGRFPILFGGPPQPGDGSDLEENDGLEESPTYVLSETLQELEVDQMQPDYYVERANNLVELFKDHSTLKYDLVWSDFGLRIQVMLLSNCREIVASGYRLARYAISDLQSIRTLRSFHTDKLTVFSLVKDNRSNMEREQALKFVRAFLDVKNGVRELSLPVVRTLVSIAEHQDDRLRNICIMTLTEILVRDPELVFSADGIGILNEALSEGIFGASESLATSFLHILDTPCSRKFFRGGSELETVFAVFTESLQESERSGKLKSAAKAISAMLKTWPGLLTLSRDGAKPLRSLLDSLQYPGLQARDLILELLFDALRIKPPSWSSSFLAGRRLTTYGRVTNLSSESNAMKQSPALYDEGNNRFDLTAHFSSLVFATFVKAGLVPALSGVVADEPDLSLKRKATLLLTEILKLSQKSLPRSISDQLQILPHLVVPHSYRQLENDDDNTDASTSIVYQIDSINRTLTRTDGMPSSHGRYSDSNDLSSTFFMDFGDQPKTKLSASMDEAHFRNVVMDTHVLSSTNYMKWKWDLIYSIIEGPLTNPKRLDEAIKGSKFMKRLVGFYRPFKRRFSECKNTKPNQRYVRTGCALMRVLIQSPEGTRYLVDNKLLRQIAECLAQVDRQSGLTSSSPLFSREAMAETLSGGYFALLGTLSSELNGLFMLERWHMINMFNHIVELQDRPDLIQSLLGNMDYSLESHLRIILSKALTAGTKEIRIFSTKLLRKYAVRTRPAGNNAANRDWVVKLLVTQLYDPDVAVSEIAVKILEEACNQQDCLEYIIKCRPALDHLGEIGAPLLLRFLSTSVGYHYLDGLDYITQEMDDWFLGRNDSYVTLVEASLSRAYIDQPRRSSFLLDDLVTDMQDIGLVPPHFYRELARTTEGCKLLSQSGHFNEFASTIRDFDLNEEDPEILLKVKGCLWAVGNIGSMELSAPFLEDTEVVGHIVRIAESAGVLTMRGTAFFALGLISCSRHGLEMLIEAGWDTPVDDNGRPLGWCIPCNLDRLYSVPFPKYVPDPDKSRRELQRYKGATKHPDPHCQTALKLLVDLGNTILAKRAALDLQVLKAKHPHVFRDQEVFQKSWILLESHHYRIQARRFALDSFDKSVIRKDILGKDNNVDGEANSEDDTDSDSIPSDRSDEFNE